MIRRVELGQAGNRLRWWVPAFARAFDQGRRPKIQRRGQLADDCFVHLSRLRSAQIIDRHSSPSCQFVITELEAALRLTDDVSEIIFQRNRCHAWTENRRSRRGWEQKKTRSAAAPAALINTSLCMCLGRRADIPVG